MEGETLKNDLLSMFQGRSACTNGDVNDAHGTHVGVMKNGLLQCDARIEDDIKNAFQEALRDALSPYDSSKRNDIGNGDDPGIDPGAHQRRGIKMFMQMDIGAGIFDHFHIGMRSNDDATRVIRSLQGERLRLKMVLPHSFLRHAAADFSAVSPKTLLEQKTIIITTGKLYLDYADIILPKRGANQRTNRKTPVKARGEPSKSECTSATAHVKIEGLHVIPDFVSVREEQMMMAGLTGPHAPWAPPQFTPAGGHIKRRVQHYGTH